MIVMNTRLLNMGFTRKGILYIHNETGVQVEVLSRDLCNVMTSAGVIHKDVAIKYVEHVVLQEMEALYDN